LEEGFTQAPRRRRTQAATAASTGYQEVAVNRASHAMNVLDGPDPHLAVDHLVGIFHRLFAAYWSTFALSGRLTT
jgi:hypothetical protein